MCLGRKTESAMDAENLDILGETVESRKIPRETEIESFVMDDFYVPENKEIGEKFMFDAAEARMDKLEGKLENEEEEVCLMFEEEAEIESKVHDTLGRHVKFWQESGASHFAVSVVLNRYVSQMWQNP